MLSTTITSAGISGHYVGQNACSCWSGDGGCLYCYVSIKWCALQHGHIVLMALTLNVQVHTSILKLLDLLSVPKESNFHFYRQFSLGRTLSPGIIKWADRALPPSAADFLQPLLNKVHFCTEGVISDLAKDWDISPVEEHLFTINFFFFSYTELLNYVLPSSQLETKTEHSLYFPGLLSVSHNSCYHKFDTPKGCRHILPQRVFFQLERTDK